MAPATPPASGLLIIGPLDGATVTEQSILVRGLAQPGSAITHDVPLRFDQHTTTDSAGRWSFAVTLNQGENVLVFRVGDDRSTERTLTINYRP